MAVRTIITKTHPTLRKIAEPVGTWNNHIESLATDLLETLEHTGDAGVGLSANQIDALSRMFVARIFPDGKVSSKNLPKPQVFINPEIIDQAKQTNMADDPEKNYLEGCLSLPDIYAFVERPCTITLTYHTHETLKKKPRTTHSYIQ